jgi:DNA mismatch endonuclease (patch repair protein)
MLGNRRRDTSPELVIRRLLHSHGLRYRVDWPLPFDRRRRADIVFTKQKVAIFIDGCFWHGCPEHYIAPRANRAFWADKVAGNEARDRDTDRRLRDLGWTVLRFWEHQDPSQVDQVVRELIAARRSITSRRGSPTESFVNPSAGVAKE